MLPVALQRAARLWTAIAHPGGGTENFFLDGERAAVQRLCLGVALLRIAECGKIVQIDRHFIMGGTVCPLENC